MITGLSGSLLSHDALERLLRNRSADAVTLPRADASADRLRSWFAQIRERIGPSSHARGVFDAVAEPLARVLGFRAIPVEEKSGTVDALLQYESRTVCAMVVAPWGQAQVAVWRHAVRRGIAHGVRWCLCVNGTTVGIVDVERAYARRYAEFDLAVTLEDENALAVFWGLLHATAIAPKPGGAVLEKVVTLCERHRGEVRHSLRDGVHEALMHFVAAFRAASRKAPDTQLVDESLVVIYRVLFLLFAEARGLVPSWHPVYRDCYTVEAFQEQLARSLVPPGIWEALQAIARLAHRGCRAGTLRVPPFNGRLFSRRTRRSRIRFHSTIEPSPAPCSR